MSSKSKFDKPLHPEFPRCCVVFEPGKKVEVIYGHFKRDGFHHRPNWSARALYAVLFLIFAGTLIYFRGGEKEIEHYADHQAKEVAAAQPVMPAEQVSKVPIWYPEKMAMHIPLDTGTHITIDGKDYLRGGDGVWHFTKPKPQTVTIGTDKAAPVVLPSAPVSAPPSDDEPHYGPRSGTGAVDDGD